MARKGCPISRRADGAELLTALSLCQATYDGPHRSINNRLIRLKTSPGSRLHIHSSRETTKFILLSYPFSLAIAKSGIQQQAVLASLNKSNTSKSNLEEKPNSAQLMSCFSSLKDILDFVRWSSRPKAKRTPLDLRAYD